jgi:hypothetical protein
MARRRDAVSSNNSSSAVCRDAWPAFTVALGFAEGVDVTSSEEALDDSTFSSPGVTFVASTGDYGAADPEYPAFSPNVVAVGGTSLTLSANNSYNGETGWGYYSNAVGTFIGSGGGISLYEAEPAFQQGVQSTGYRTTPDERKRQPSYDRGVRKMLRVSWRGVEARQVVCKPASVGHTNGT